MQSKFDFIIAAINDTQGTIRATDVKVCALLAGMILPLPLIGRIWAHFVHIADSILPCAAVIFGAVFFLMWVVIIVTLVKTISAIDNPAHHIKNSHKFKGTFYGGGLYKFRLHDALFNRKNVVPLIDAISYSDTYPAEYDDINSELAFEHMKLIYIRDIKLFRLGVALEVALLWLLIGIMVYVVSKLW